MIFLTIGSPNLFLFEEIATDFQKSQTLTTLTKSKTKKPIFELSCV